LKAAVVLGTRPEIVKMSPIVRELQRKNLDFFILHTGQHYSYEMDRVFFEELSLPSAKYNLDVGSGSQADQTSRILVGVEMVLLEEKPDVVLVEGDTNSVMAGALAAAKLHVPVGHVEAGLRSFDRSMPEEINRVVADHVSDYLFAPTETSRRNLLNEGISDENIYVTGNTVVDAVNQNLELSRRVDALSRYGLEEGAFFLVTLHRAENVDSEMRLGKIFSGLRRIKDKYSLPILFPVHPRTRKMIDLFGFNLDDVSLVEPVSYLDFLGLESEARLVLTDSGGVQEETCILGVPCVTLRDNTERPETVEVGSNIVSGVEEASILSAVEEMLRRDRGWGNPFGDGCAGERILNILCEVDGRG
jgi:UDP-N-acetylglucosamine 2-epimerase (non-hydrolysing)